MESDKFMISIVPEQLELTRLRIYYKDKLDKHVDIYVKIPSHIRHDECLSAMEKYIDSNVQYYDITNVLEVAKQFIFKNNLYYYQVFKLV